MRRLKAREYKLLLDFSRFPSAMTAARANAFWRRHVERVIDHVLDTKKGGGSRAKGEFKAPVTRRVTFWDTEEGLLAAHDYALRERADDPNDASPRNLLLKLRTPDMFISGAGNLAGKADAVLLGICSRPAGPRRRRDFLQMPRRGGRRAARCGAPCLCLVHGSPAGARRPAQSALFEQDRARSAVRKRAVSLGAPSLSLRPQVKSARIWSGRTRPEIRPPAQCPSGRGKTWT